MAGRFLAIEREARPGVDVDDEDFAPASQRALAAARQALERLAAINRMRRQKDEPELRTGIGLHLGEVIYGNVGAADRLDFTVIGPAVNEAARIEALCKDLGRPLLVSDAFAASASASRRHLMSLGHHQLRGVREPTEIFALTEADAPQA